MNNSDLSPRQQGKTHKAITAMEQQLLRHMKTIHKALLLLKSARDDGGLTKVQSDSLDKLVAQNERIVVGLDQEAFGLTKSERLLLADFLDSDTRSFDCFLERRSTAVEDSTAIIERLRTNF